MLKLQLLLFLSGTFLVFFYILQDSVDCRPVFFQGYHKKQQKIRENRLKKSAAEVRFEDLTKKYRRRNRSEWNANRNDVGLYHPNRSKWIKKDMLHTKVKGNLTRHRLAGKYLGKETPEMRDIFDRQADLLQNHSDDLHLQKHMLKGQGQNDYTNDDLRDNNFDKDQKVYDKYVKKATKCVKAKNEYDRRISEAQNQNRCSIL